MVHEIDFEAKNDHACASGGGVNLIGLRYGDVPLFRGTFFLKSAELWVSFSEVCAELWVPFEETCGIMGTTLDSSRSLILFEDYAVTEEDNLNFKLVRIQRMLNKINRKRVEYKEPVPFGDKCIPTLDMLCQVYQAISPGCYQISSEVCPKLFPGAKVLCHVNLEFDQESQTFKLPAPELEALNETLSRNVIRNEMQTRQRISTERADSTKNSFDGTFRETVEPSVIADGTRRSQRTRTIINHLH